MPHRPPARPLSVWVEPVDVFRVLEASSPEVFWLDAGPDTANAWSFVGVGEPSALPADVALGEVRGAPADGGAADDERPPFRGGWVGWHDYETGAAAAGAPTDGGDADDRASWMRVRRFAAFDHARRRVWVQTDGDVAQWESFVEEAAVAASALPDLPKAPVAGVVAEARHEPAEYAGLIERCRDLIRQGIAYQLCLTTRFSVSGVGDAVAVYARLRAATPAHHGGFVRIRGRALLSASPEQFLLASDGVIRTRPIKGTRPRSADPIEDAALAAELAVNPKERAENVMIVDLMRNDLSRVCVAGSIRVEGLWVVESYPAVHQLVSTVSGTAAPGATVGSLLDAAFPAGSMTGAPKLSAMTRLHALEGGPRGIYA
ncbi:MAG: anthranilate synthase component I family protein, partial [Microbacterium sp.]|nr:anthranilate synthase component I family protein [Microbacterium sp.]